MSRTTVCTLAFAALTLGTLFAFFADRPLHAQYMGAYPGAPEQYYQPVQLRGPEGTQVSFAIEGKFVQRPTAPEVVGLRVGPDYRVRLTNLPFLPGKELFPSIKLIGRTFPPQGRVLEFPVLIDITQDDIDAVLKGQFVTRVIYLEDPRSAMPIRGDLGYQTSIDVMGSDDPIKFASTLGQPVAILRLGGRIPSPEALAGNDPVFFHGCPPWLAFDRVSPDLYEATLYQNTFQQPGMPAALFTVPQLARTENPVATIDSSYSTNPNEVIIDPALAEIGPKIIEQHRAGKEEFQGSWRPPQVAGFWPQNEYLADGGDDGMKVRVDEDWGVHNLGVEDAVAHFDTLDNRILVEPSNRVHLYAPRFGSVRKIDGILNSDQITALSGTKGYMQLDKEQSRAKAGTAAQESQAGYARVRDQLGGVRGRNASAAADGTLTAGGYGTFESVMLYSNLLRQQSIKASEILYLAEGSANAHAWMGAEGTKVRINILAPMIASSEEGAASFFQIEDESKSSKLRLIKVASKKVAQPGDIVEFTFRFDNVGNQIIGNVTILDSLTTRLEFVPGSAKSSVDSGFSVQSNDAGSLVVRFEVTAPLKPGEFGVVQFQCRVR